MPAAADTPPGRAVYVYGIVPADVETDPAARGIGHPPRPITVVRHQDIAALVSAVDTDRPLGEPEDLVAHARLLDATAGEVPVLPMRFGAVVADEQTVTDELLGGHHEEFRAALRELDGFVQFVVKGRYVEPVILREVLAENEEAARLRETVQGEPDEAARSARIALGELVGNAVAAKRDADTRQVVEALGPLDVPTNPREPTHELDAVHLACLVEVGRQRDLAAVVTGLAEDWSGRIELRLLGPLAAYDFMTTNQG